MKGVPHIVGVPLIDPPITSPDDRRLVHVNYARLQNPMLAGAPLIPARLPPDVAALVITTSDGGKTVNTIQIPAPRDPFDVIAMVEKSMPPEAKQFSDERWTRYQNSLRVTRGGKSPAAAGHMLPALPSANPPGGHPLPRAAGVRDTSRRAYRALKYSGKLAKRQQQVLDVFLRDPAATWTRQELAREAGLGVNIICGRIAELIELGLVEEYGEKTCSVTTENVNALRLAAEGG